MKKWQPFDPSKPLNLTPEREKKPAPVPVRRHAIDMSNETYHERLKADRTPQHPCNGGCGRKFHLDGITCVGCKIAIERDDDLPF